MQSSYLGRKYWDHQHACFCLPSLSFCCWAQCHMAQNIHLISWGQLSQLCPYSTSCSPPSYLLGAQSGKKKSALTLCVHCSAIAKTSVCYQHCLVANPKHSTILAAVNKVNSIQARSTMCRRLAASLVIFLSI